MERSSDRPLHDPPGEDVVEMLQRLVQDQDFGVHNLSVGVSL